MQLVGGEQVPLAEEEVASRVLPERDPGEDERRPRRPSIRIQPSDRGVQRTSPSITNSSAKGTRKKEAFSIAFELDRIRALDRVSTSVAANTRCSHTTAGDSRRVGRVRAAARRRPARCGHAAPRTRSRARHRRPPVQRHEEVRGLASELHRDSEREHRKCGDREAPREAAEDRRDDRRRPRWPPTTTAANFSGGWRSATRRELSQTSPATSIGAATAPPPQQPSEGACFARKERAGRGAAGDEDADELRRGRVHDPPLRAAGSPADRPCRGPEPGARLAGGISRSGSRASRCLCARSRWSVTAL